ncbi:hypothetical protein ACVWW3_001373 [Bradyrhizobium sp. LM2.9]
MAEALSRTPPSMLPPACVVPVAWITSGLILVSVLAPLTTLLVAPIAPAVELISTFLPITTGLATS